MLVEVVAVFVEGVLFSEVSQPSGDIFSGERLFWLLKLLTSVLHLLNWVLQSVNLVLQWVKDLATSLCVWVV